MKGRESRAVDRWLSSQSAQWWMDTVSLSVAPYASERTLLHRWDNPGTLF